MSSLGDAPASAGIQATAAVAIATLQYETLRQQINKQDAIAQRVQDRADELQALWRDVYKTGELETAAEIFNTPLQAVDTGAVTLRAEAEFRSQLDRAKQDALLCIDSQCAGARCEVSRAMDLKAAGLTAYGIEAALRAEEARVTLVNRQRIADRVAMIGTGHQTFNQVAGMMTSALASQTAQANAASAAFSGALQAVGASWRRVESAGRPGTPGTPAPVETRMPTPVEQSVDNVPDYTQDGGTPMPPADYRARGISDAMDNAFSDANRNTRVVGGGTDSMYVQGGETVVW